MPSSTCGPFADLSNVDNRKLHLYTKTKVKEDAHHLLNEFVCLERMHEASQIFAEVQGEMLDHLISKRYLEQQIEVHVYLKRHLMKDLPETDDAVAQWCRDVFVAKISGESVGEVKVVSDTHERKTEMALEAKAFIALPGGYGTMEELMEMITWEQLGIHEKPVGLLNIDGYYNPLLTLFDNGVEEGFIKPSARHIVLSAPTAQELLTKMEATIGINFLSKTVILKIELYICGRGILLYKKDSGVSFPAI